MVAVHNFFFFFMTTSTQSVTGFRRRPVLSVGILSFTILFRSMFHGGGNVSPSILIQPAALATLWENIRQEELKKAGIIYTVYGCNALICLVINRDGFILERFSSSFFFLFHGSNVDITVRRLP